MQRILVTGSNGMVGQKVCEQLLKNPQIKLWATSLSANKLPAVASNFSVLDITRAPELFEAVENFNPHVIINCAGMTQVDPCELNKKDCWEMNTGAVSHLIKAANSSGAKLVQLSTDFVFDGNKGLYTERDAPNPISYYGQSKWEAEKLIVENCKHYAIVRTVLVYGVTATLSRSNLVLWVKESLEAHKKIQVVDDQFRTPTYAEDLAWGVVKIALGTHTGIFHISGDTYLSVYEIAMQTAEFFKLDTSLIVPIASDQLNQAGKRPPKTGFDIGKARELLGYKPKNLNSGLGKIKEQLEKLN